MRVALIHYWLVNWRGGEKVLAALAELFPQADIFTHVCRPEILLPELRSRRITDDRSEELPVGLGGVEQERLRPGRNGKTERHRQQRGEVQSSSHEFPLRFFKHPCHYISLWGEGGRYGDSATPAAEFPADRHE